MVVFFYYHRIVDVWNEFDEKIFGTDSAYILKKQCKVSSKFVILDFITTN